MHAMKSAHAIIFAILGVAMFSGNVWMQRNWRPGTSGYRGDEGVGAPAGEPDTASIESAAVLAPVAQEQTSEEPAVESPEDWAVEQVILK